MTELTPDWLAKVRARLDRTNDLTCPENEREVHNLNVYLNARRDIGRLLRLVARQAARISELEQRAARTEAATSYALIRPANDTLGVVKRFDGEAEAALMSKSGPKPSLPAAEPASTLSEILRNLSAVAVEAAERIEMKEGDEQ